MNTANLLAKLVEIERTADGAGFTRVRTMAIDAQQDALRMEQELMETLLENQRLLDCLEDASSGSEYLAEFAALQDGDAGHGEFSARLMVDRARRKSRSFWIN